MDWSGIAGFAGLAIITTLGLLWPLLRRRAQKVDRFEAELALCRDQLAEIRRDLDLGVITPQAARAAEVEIKRRMVELDRAREREAAHARPGGREARLVGAIAALAVPVVATLLYLGLGRPDLPDMPLAARDDVAGRKAVAAGGGGDGPSLREVVARLEQRVAQDPQDVRSRLLLARAYVTLERYRDAARMFAEVRALDPDLPGIDAARGEALVLAEQGVVGEPARRAFEAELARNPDDPRARFYLALAEEQAGDDESALKRYVALGRDSPPDAPWLDEVRERIQAVAARLGRDPEPLLAELGQGGPEAEIAALERTLETDPRRWRDWIRLAQLRAEVGDLEGARAALARARELYADAPFVQRQLAQAEARILGGGNEGAADAGEARTAARGPSPAELEAAAEMSPEEQQAMIRGMVAQLAERLKRQPDDIEGWRMLARSYGVLGEREKMIAAYRHIAERLPEDARAQLDYARALLRTNAPDKPLSTEVVAAFERVLALDPDQPDALFFVGLGAVQRNNPARARELWTRLLPQLPEGSRVRQELEKRLEALPKEAS